MNLPSKTFPFKGVAKSITLAECEARGQVKRHEEMRFGRVYWRRDGLIAKSMVYLRLINFESQPLTGYAGASVKQGGSAKW